MIGHWLGYCSLTAEIASEPVDFPRENAGWLSTCDSIFAKLRLSSFCRRGRIAVCELVHNHINLSRRHAGLWPEAADPARWLIASSKLVSSSIRYLTR